METGAVGERFKETFELQCGESRDIPKAPATKEGNRVLRQGRWRSDFKQTVLGVDGAEDTGKKMVPVDTN